jgi:UDP-N-acetylmuramyl pentapeptide phosphotransferase/UDP-N-acetylglucosamine-1-phosphate transferase
MLSQTLDWIAAHPFVTGAALVVSLALALIYGAVIYVAIGRMHPDYFVRDETSSSAWRQRYPLLGGVALLLKNAFGVVLVLMGLAMLVLPGQGVLTLLIGIGLLDLPGKRNLEKKIVRTSTVRKTMDAIRRRAGQPPLVLPD